MCFTYHLQTSVLLYIFSTILHLNLYNLSPTSTVNYSNNFHAFTLLYIFSTLLAYFYFFISKLFIVSLLSSNYLAKLVIYLLTIIYYYKLNSTPTPTHTSYHLFILTQPSAGRIMEEEQAVADLAATLPQVDGAGDSDTDSDNQEDFQPALQEQVLRCVL